ncbi:PDZ domain-containing protein 8-like isoform X2 [Pomacea canaliculata]|uniref:PDZ domain-containing protein 8-like isoform X2 n=1 Tax=Pomacea canaliculata TaxID=400727 RepID=UPI000D727555|nr:PDZ domain-containing protein 8-like isoform X2 [Pomacea canaliculata]
MLLEVALLSLVAGAVLTVAVQMFFVRWYLYRTPPQPPPYKDHYPKISVPQGLKEKFKATEKGQDQESCFWLNLFGHFLFQELRDTNIVRRWVKQKLNVEFEELLQSTSGKFLAQIILRDFSLGTGFPLVGGVSVQDISIDEEDVVQEPEVQFDVESHFEGHPLPQVGSLVINQLRRVIRQKHTLPNHKMRFKPLFQKPEALPPAIRLELGGQSISSGRLCITFIRCTRLPLVAHEATLYCILCADTKPWKEIVRGQSRVWVLHDVEVIKALGESIGMTFKDIYNLDRRGIVVTVDIVQVDSAAARADIRKDDVLVSVGTSRITSSKQAAKLIKNAGDRFTIRLERPHVKLPQDARFQEEAVFLKDMDGAKTDTKTEENEGFINISVQHTASDSVLVTAGGRQAKEQEFLILDDGGIAGPSGGLKPSTIIHQSHSAVELLKPSLDIPGRAGSPRVRHNLTVPSIHSLATGKVVANETTKNLQPSHTKSAQGSPRRDHSPSPAHEHSHHAAYRHKVGEEAFGGTGADSDSDEEAFPIMKTREVPATRNPRWHDPLTFDLSNHHTYLNVCVWCHLRDTTDFRSEKSSSSSSQSSDDILMGQVSVPINIIVLHCLMTLRGHTKQTLQLQPGDVKVGASQSAGGRIGLEHHRCYGDITLHFQFTPTKLSLQQQRMLAADLDPENSTGVRIVPATSDSSQDELGSDLDIGLYEGKHLFSKAQFNSATYCNFCGKKIWLKVAFQCSLCGMICHKKCIDKCRAETLCSDDGPRRRNAPGEFWRTPLASLKQPETLMNAHLPQSHTRGTRFLSKFSKEPVSTGTEKDGVKATKGQQSVGSPQISTKSQPKDEAKFPHDSQFHQDTLDDAAITSAKEMGRQLFSHMDISSRKAKLDVLVNKTQEEINQEIANKIALNKQLQTAETHTSRTSLNATITNSNNKIESLMLLQLQYCAGLQHCLDQEEEQRQQAQANAVADLAVLQNISMSPQAKESIASLTPAECKDDIPAEDGQEAVDFEEQTASAVAQVLNKVIHFDDDSSLSDENNEDEEDTWR